MYTKHKFNFFPEINEEEFQGLKNSIATGFDSTLGKITLFEGEILDGWNRYKACIETDVQPVFTEFQGNEEEAFQFSIKANQDRRHLTKSQLAAIAIEAEHLVEAIQAKVEEERRRKIAEARIKQEAEKKEREAAEAKRLQEQIRIENERIKREAELAEEEAIANEQRKQHIAAEKERIAKEREAERIAEIERLEKQKVDVTINCHNSLSDIERQENTGNTKLAVTFGTNRQYISDAKKLKETNPERFEEIKRGEKTITEVKKELKKEQDQQKKEDYNKRVEAKTDNAFKVDIFNTSEKFRVIYADPAWSYNDKQDTPQLGGAAKHYDTMSISQLCELPVNEISEKNSVLFLWVTSPLLEDAFKVINSWGFKYKTSFIWDKVKHNMGHYNSVRHELLLIATKGSCTPDKKKLFDSVQSIERNENHSEKPIQFLNIIDELYEYGDKLEMFCRSIKKENWFGWGNEL